MAPDLWNHFCDDGKNKSYPAVACSRSPHRGILIENTEVYGFRAALRGMRNPRMSWEESDSRFWGSENLGSSGNSCQVFQPEVAIIGPKDLQRACSLIKAGVNQPKVAPSHRKFSRQIVIWVDFTLPRFIWAELDTYHGDPESVALSTQPVRDSCSSMDKIWDADLTQSDFLDRKITPEALGILNRLAKMYRGEEPQGVIPELGLDATTATQTELLHEIKCRIPESFLQRATYTMNYETALTMYFQRRHHRLPEWSGPSGICAWIAELPYMHEFIAALDPLTNTP